MFYVLKTCLLSIYIRGLKRLDVAQDLKVNKVDFILFSPHHGNEIELM
jgi:hypothetical protein